MRVLRVGDVMSKPVVALERDHSIHLASSILKLRHIRHLPVIDGAGKLVGLVTHRDVVSAQSALLATAHDDRKLSVEVGKVMHENVWVVHPDTPVLEAGRIMHDHKFGCLPVVSDERLVGIITEADLVGVLLRLLERSRDREETDPRIQIGEP